MAKHGFRMIDAEMHVMEAVDLWDRYIDPEFKDRAPRRLSERRWDIRTIVEGEVMATVPGGDGFGLSAAEEQTLADRYAEEIRRNFDAASQVRAMDREGLDLAVLFPTAFDRMDAVSGGTEGARTRDLLVMAGGDPAAIARARPELDAIATRVLHTGEIGSGTVAKLMHNCAAFTLDLVMAECWTVAVKAGVAPETIVAAFTEGHSAA